MVKNQYSATEAVERLEKEGFVFYNNKSTVENFYKRILDLEKANKNGIWARFLKNAFAPMIAGKFDFVVGNPPWIRWDYLSQDYRNATLQLWKDYGLFSMKKTHGFSRPDFCMLFVYASSDYFLKDSAKLGFLITQEVYKSKGAGEGFRRFRLGDKEYLKVLKAHDLVTIQPFEGAANKTAAIILKKGEKTNYPLPYILWSRKKGIGKIAPDKLLSEVLPLLSMKKFSAEPMSSNTSAWQTYPKGFELLLKGIKNKNYYKAEYGVETKPYGVFWIKILQLLSDGNVIITNLSDAGKRKISKIEEKVEQDLIYPSLRGSDIKRWGVEQKIFIFLTHDMCNGKPIIESQFKNNFPRTYSYFTKFKKDLLSIEAKSTKKLREQKAFYSRFGIGDYTFSNFKVVWQRMSNDIFAAVVSEIKTPFGYKKVTPLDTTSFFAISNETEAHYLCAIINSNPVRDFIKSFSSAGRGFGTPSVMEHVGIPKFDPNDKLHQKLADISKQCHELKLKGQEQDIQTLEKENDNLVKKLFKIK